MAPLAGPTPRSPSEELRLRGSCRAAFMPGDHEPREDAGPWLRAPVLRSAPEGGDPHPGLGPTAYHGHSPGEEVGAPEGPVGALDKGRETGSTRWGPSPTYLGVAAGAARLPPLAHSQDLHPETWLGLRARWGPHLPSLGSCPIHLRPLVLHMPLSFSVYRSPGHSAPGEHGHRWTQGLEGKDHGDETS